MLTLAAYSGATKEVIVPKYLVGNGGEHIILHSIFPIDNIAKIKITNNYGECFLTENKLTNLKIQLKNINSNRLIPSNLFLKSAAKQ